MDFTKPYESIGFGAVDVTKSYEFNVFSGGGLLFTQGVTRPKAH